MTVIADTVPVLFVVDDDPLMCEFVARVAKKAGYHPQIFQSGREMLARLDECPDALILDISMPDLDGFQVLDALQGRNFAGRLIIASGFFSDVIHMAECLAEHKKLNLVGKLVKPFLAAQLEELLALPRLEGSGAGTGA